MSCCQATDSWKQPMPSSRLTETCRTAGWGQSSSVSISEDKSGDIGLMEGPSRGLSAAHISYIALCVSSPLICPASSRVYVSLPSLCHLPPPPPPSPLSLPPSNVSVSLPSPLFHLPPPPPSPFTPASSQCLRVSPYPPLSPPSSHSLYLHPCLLPVSPCLSPPLHLPPPPPSTPAPASVSSPWTNPSSLRDYADI